MDFFLDDLIQFLKFLFVETIDRAVGFFSPIVQFFFRLTKKLLTIERSNAFAQRVDLIDEVIRAIQRPIVMFFQMVKTEIRLTTMAADVRHSPALAKLTEDWVRHGE